ncbi:hypothetical protein HUJ04_005779 [Dendroctonus ponderosae]|nr:hypothetical protein HUJ04_005779 [Dendroctonus ponderosae]KAH1004776.1 hypothetical protein HUJ05_005552 [Dendroctonus ponderosae]
MEVSNRQRGSWHAWWSVQCQQKPSKNPQYRLFFAFNCIKEGCLPTRMSMVGGTGPAGRITRCPRKGLTTKAGRRSAIEAASCMTILPL